ncbi:MAG TPA: HAMP domain-containing sensor histidine kinase, partial [Myxococcaceae bacterium]|nr:HAMP domain-containing sensor histidine kinase [Myxococcaceae bacterium]
GTGGKFSERVLIWSFGIVVASFLVSAAYFQYRVRDIDDDALSIAHNALPSIEHLSAARSQLQHLRELVQVYSGKLDQKRPVDASISQSVEARLNEELRLYLLLPFYAGERDAGLEIGRLAPSIKRVVQKWSGLVQEGGSPEERRATENRLLIGMDELVSAINGAVGANMTEARELALGIARVRNSSIRMLWVLNVGSLLIAALAATLAIRALRAYRTLRDSHAKLLSERADELEAFASRVAHDILSPLGSVSLGLDLAISQNRSNPRAGTVLTRARANVHKVKTIVNGLLTFARSGARPESNASTNVQPTLAGLLDDWTRSAAEVGIELEFEVAECGAVACSDGVLTSVLENLIRNAIKYMGDRTERRIRVRVWNEAPAVRFEVEDTGPGLDPELKDRAFQPYVRGAKTSQPGIGLGLATVKRLVEAHGGAVGVRSQLGKGSTFWFRLPKAVTEKEPAPLAGSPLETTGEVRC